MLVDPVVLMEGLLPMSGPLLTIGASEVLRLGPALLLEFEVMISKEQSEKVAAVDPAVKGYRQTRE